MKRICSFKLRNSNPNKNGKIENGKTAAASILKDAPRLRKEFEFFKFLNFDLFNCKPKRTG